MKIFTFSRSSKAQAAAEYLIFLGIIVAVTLTAFSTYIPKVVAQDGTSGHAVKYFSNVVKKINGEPYASGPPN